MKLSWRFLLPLLVLGLAFSLRLYHLDFQSIWWDEGHSLFVASHSISQIPTLPAMDVHPPAYFALLHLWMNLTGRSEFALRYLSVIFSLLTIALIWRFATSLSRRLPVSSPHSSWPPLLASFFGAISPLYVAYAQEVRSYSMITFLALASTYILWQIICTAGFADQRSAVSHHPSSVVRPRSAVVLYIFLTAACLYTHYFTIFLLLFHNLAWLVWSLFPGRSESRNSLPRSGRILHLATWLASQLGILLLFAPQLFLALRQVTTYTNPNLSPPSLSEFITRSWQAYTIGLAIDPGPTQWGMVAIAGVLTVTVYQLKGCVLRVASYVFGSTQHPTPNTQHPIRYFSFLISWFLLPLAAYFIVLQRQSSFEPRYMILVTPALFLLLALGLARLHFTHHVSHFTFHVSRFTFHVLFSITLIVFIAGLYSYYTNETYFKDDSAGVADWLATETTANDLVYVDVPHPFHYYVDKNNIVAPTRYLFVDIHTAADTLTQEASGRNRLFWITWRGSDTDPRGVIPFLAQKYGRELGRRQFRGYEVEWFSLPGVDTVFKLPTDLPPVHATFGDVLRLDGAAYGGFPPPGVTTPASHPAWATLHLTLLRDTEVNYKVSVRLRGEDGNVVSQVDKDLLNDRHFRTSAWPLDDPALNKAINVYTLPLTPDTPPGSYRLEVVVYDAQPPYPSEGVTGPASSDGVAAVIGNIIVIP